MDMRGEGGQRKELLIIEGGRQGGANYEGNVSFSDSWKDIRPCKAYNWQVTTLH